MKWIKNSSLYKFLLSAIVACSLFAFVSSDCYDTWRTGYDSLTSQYNNYMESINFMSHFSPPKARINVQAWYNANLELLTDQYYDCVMG